MKTIITIKHPLTYNQALSTNASTTPTLRRSSDTGCRRASAAYAKPEKS